MSSAGGALHAHELEVTEMSDDEPVFIACAGESVQRSAAPNAVRNA